ncbi:MAG: LPS export ABC transporter periplasmic protein LptC [Candidatus Omnitrophica bacterium]|nr:LPS export ABC transporter periplasmic protein LptC [Candidatus Omnitrophota bacterium]MCK5180300.1 LPS export ABC transporter periplasmic protein LptC [Candidatus Omnitrophota bacterium]
MKFKFTTFIAVAIMFCLSAGWISAEEPEQKFHGFNLQGYDDTGEKAWNVNGDTADIMGSEIILSNVDANTFGDQKMNVTAKKGTVDQISGKMRLEDDVVITSEDGKRLMTDTLDWDRNEDLVTTEDDVTIIDERMMATGTGMEAHPGLKTAEIKEDVTVMIETEPEKKEESQTVTITSDGPMIIDQAVSFATFEDNVVAVQEGRTLKADRMEVYFDDQMAGITKMVCLGNVEIEQGENRTFAQKAVYNAADQKLILSGRPKLILLTEGESLFAASGN